MKNIIYHLYYGNLGEAERSIDDLLKTKESKAADEMYDKLAATLSQPQKDMLENFLESECLYSALEKERLFANAFKTGVWLGLELADFKPENY